MGRLGFGDALQDVLAALRVELGQDVVEQHHGQLADLGAHPIGFGQLQGQDRQALLTARAVAVQVDAVEDEGEVVAVGTDQRDGLVDLTRGDALLALAETVG